MRLFYFVSLLLATAVLAEETKPCVFCEIVAGKREAAIVYRDADVVAFMDNSPQNPGHVLVLPVRHADGILDLPPADARAMITVAQKIAQAIKRTDLTADGIRLQFNTGAAAGQSIAHAHLHIIPKLASDVEAKSNKPRVALAELEPLAQKIRAKLE
ncbi:MAG: HIT family protein [Lacunisphaera sp.]|nr:HIT family protein [Lacunisphaera sp.]